MKKEKQVTINELARMINRGFEGANQNFDLKISELRAEMNERFDKIEKTILADHKRRIEQLEVDMRLLKSSIAL